MSIKTQIKKLEHYQLHPRSTAARLGALILTAATLFNLLELNHDPNARQAKRDVLGQAPYSLNSARENETMRMPVKLDDGLRAIATTGQ